MDRTTSLPSHVVVVVRRAGRWWLAETATGGVVRTRSLHSAVRQARELVGEGAAVHYQFHTGDPELDRLVIQIRAARLAAKRLELRAKRLTGKVLRLPSGGSLRDVALLVGLSYQRVHQLMRQGGAQQGEERQHGDGECPHEPPGEDTP
jgi:hypothetical protein